MLGRRSIVVAVAAALAFGAAPDASAAVPRANVPITAVVFGDAGLAGRHGIDVTLAVTEPADAPFFYAQQIGFEGDLAAGGYVGLQTRGPRHDGPTPGIGRVAVFSMFGACDPRAGTDGCSGLLHASPSDGGFCRPMTDAQGYAPEGPGQQCFFPYEWEVRRSYRLSIESAGPLLWRGVVRDLRTGVATVVGTIEVPRGWGTLNEQALTWVEFYGEVRTCRDIPRTAARWSQPRARGPLDSAGIAPEYAADGTTRPRAGETLCHAATGRLGPDVVEHVSG